MKSKSYTCPKSGKGIKPSSHLIRHINVCKILITLPNYQSSNSPLILEYNTINHLDFWLNNDKEDISLRESNNSEEKIRPVDINNNKKDIKPADID